MKKVMLSLALLAIVSTNSFAYKTISYEINGTKAGPTNVNPNGTISVDCDVSAIVCERITITVYDLQQDEPAPGDPTEVEVFSASGSVEPEEVYTGGYVDHSTTPNASGVTSTVVLTELTQVL